MFYHHHSCDILHLYSPITEEEEGQRVSYLKQTKGMLNIQHLLRSETLPEGWQTQTALQTLC